VFGEGEHTCPHTGTVFRLRGSGLEAIAP
jgi:hypothetical protein